MKQIAELTLARPVNGINLVPGTFGDQLQGAPTLLAFLRHFG